MISKRIHFLTATSLGEHFAEALLVPRRGTASLEKIAGALHPEIEAFKKRVKRDPGLQYVLMTPMGAFEYYGLNANGDIFPEVSLSYNRDTDDPEPVISALVRKWLTPFGKKLPEGEPKNFGFKTFLEAKRYLNHVNKDPSIAYGDIVLSVWNPVMHRVEVIARHDRKKAEEVGAGDVIKDLDENKPRQISMGCFLKGAMVTLSDGTRKPIEQISVGDEVLTHLGRARKVTEVHVRPYTGTIYQIKPEAHETIYATTEHPFWATRTEGLRMSPASPRWRQDPQVEPCWVPASGLEGHTLLEPVLEEVQTPDYATESFARLLGYYLSEGHVFRDKKKQISGVNFTVHQDDAIHAEISDLCAAFGTRNPPVTLPHPRSEKARYIQVFDARLAELLYENGGSYSKSKKLAPGVLRWHPDIQKHILAAYLNGDGVGGANGSVQISTASDALAWQWMTILPRLGMIASIQNLEHKAGSGFSATATREWVIHIGKSCTGLLQGICQKLKPSGSSTARSSRKIIDGYVTTPIRKITAVEVEGAEVYNFEVEGDESYQVSGLAVHNCRVKFDVCTECGNIAATQAQYCSHLRNSMGKVRPDGTIVGAVNFFPVFFDLSDVRVPAAKESGVLEKIARQLRGSVPSEEHPKVALEIKEADLDKEVLPNASHRVDSLREAEPDLPSDILRGVDFGRLLATTAGLGIVLKPQEFQEAALCRLGQHALADGLSTERLVFRPAEPTGSALPSPAAFSGPLAQVLARFLDDRSGFPPYFPLRVLRIELSVPEKTASCRTVDANSPVLEKVAAAYAEYRAGLRHLPEFLSDVASENAGVYQKLFFQELLMDSFRKTASIDLPADLPSRYFSRDAEEGASSFFRTWTAQPLHPLAAALLLHRSPRSLS